MITLHLHFHKVYLPTGASAKKKQPWKQYLNVIIISKNINFKCIAKKSAEIFTPHDDISVRNVFVE